MHASLNQNEATKINFGADDSIYNGLLINGPSHDANNNGNNFNPNNNPNSSLGPIPSFERETNPYESQEGPSTTKDNNNVV